MLDLVVLENVTVPQNNHGFIFEVSRTVAEDRRYIVLLRLNVEVVLKTGELIEELFYF